MTNAFIAAPDEHSSLQTIGAKVQNLVPMKTILISLMATMLMFSPAYSRADDLSNTQLAKKIESIVSKGSFKFMAEDTQEVTVRFLINAQNEVVIFETSGDSDAMCEHVKEVLNYRQVKFKQAKQLVPYEISIQFVKQADQ
jgi:hypothetical protein